MSVTVGQSEDDPEFIVEVTNNIPDEISILRGLPTQVAVTVHATRGPGPSLVTAKRVTEEGTEIQVSAILS